MLVKQQGLLTAAQFKLYFVLFTHHFLKSMTTSPENSTLEQIVSFSKLNSRVGITLKKLKTAENTLNIKDFKAGIETLGEDFTQMENTWSELFGNLEDYAGKLREQLNSPDYPTKLESALKEQQVPFSGAFPNYDIPPFKLSINTENFTARLSMGRKSQQTGNLSPESLSLWIAKIYKNLVNSQFNHDRFCKELLEVYHYLNNSENPLPVLIKDVYKLLTIKTEAKQEYPESRFIFDISRLLNQYEIKYGEYIFDFSPHKLPAKNYTLVNEVGKERAVGNMIIRKVEG